MSQLQRTKLVNLQDTLEDLFDAWTPSTVLAYRRDLVRIGKRYITPPITDPIAVLRHLQLIGKDRTSQLLREIKNRDDVSLATRSRYIYSVRSLLGKLRQAGVLDWDVDHITPRKVTKYLDTSGPEWSVVESLVSKVTEHKINAQGPHHCRWTRNLAVLHLLCYNALRRVEVTRLNIEHVNLTRCVILVQSKGEYDVQVMPISDATCDVLNEYMTMYRKEDNPTSPLFVAHYSNDLAKRVMNQRFSPHGIAYILKECTKVAQIPHLSPHQIRHSAITRAAQVWEGNAIAVSDFARHKDPRVTKRYIDNLEQQTRSIVDLLATGKQDK